MKRCLAFIGAILMATIQALGFYNPKVGRWTTRDPKEEKADANLYLFNKNAPIYGHCVYGSDGVRDVAGKKSAGDAIQSILKPRSRCREEAFVFPWRGGFLRPYEGDFETHAREL